MRKPINFTRPDVLTGLPDNTPVLVGFSGGADSMALLHMLSRYAKETGAEITAAHVHHGIRGAEADRDEAFCRQATEALGIPLLVHHADVPALAKELGESIETAARIARYEYFDRIMLSHRIPILATAHNANDNLETMLFHLVRGSGLEGLCGIPLTRLCRGGTLIRPILSMTRQEILAYCEEQGLSYVCDSTNVDTEYTRNKIRQRILPALAEIHPAAVENAARLAENLRSDQLCLESMAALFLEELREGDSLEAEKVAGAPTAVVYRALLRIYEELTEGASLEYSHLTAMRMLAAKAVPHSSVTLPHGIEAVIEDRHLILRPIEEPMVISPYEIPLFDEETTISQTNCKIVIGPSQSEINIYKKSIQLSIDSATIKGNLFARNRQEGDKILMGGMHKSLKKLMCDKKIPLRLRQRLPIFCDDDGILAVPMIGIRDGAHPTANASVLSLQLYFS